MRRLTLWVVCLGFATFVTTVFGRTTRLAETLDGRRVFVGATIDWASYDLRDPDALVPALRARLGFFPKVLTSFVSLPLTGDDVATLEQLVPPLAAKNTVLILTTEPRDGLDAVTDEAIDRLVALVAGFEAAYQARVIVRFGHEMNGDWYAWGQQPRAFVETFRRISEKVHSSTLASMMFCPTIDAKGYPFGGRYESLRAEDRDLMDTNGDGRVDNADDPYAPYWPGDEYVDVIGGSVYFWGDSWPFGENLVPPPDHFHSALAARGFYTTYSEQKGLPMIVVETASLYNTCDVLDPRTPQCQRNEREGWLGDQRELAIKDAWWSQVYSERTAREYPMIRSINLFVVSKREQEIAQNMVEWGFGDKPWLRQAFVSHMSKRSIRQWFLLKR